MVADIISRYYSKQWHLHRQSEHPEVDIRSSLRCEEAWRQLGSFGDPEVVIGTADDGCRLEHPAFGSLDKFAGWGFFDDEGLQVKGSPRSVPPNMYSEGKHHGTSMCALIAAVAESPETVGVAPACRLLPIKLRIDANQAKITEVEMLHMLDYIAERADIFVIPWSKLPMFVLSRDVFDRICELTRTGGRRGKGVVFVCAAGNSNSPIHFSSNFPVPYNVDFSVPGSGAPRVYASKTFRNILTTIPGVLHISSISSLAQRSHYSCYGDGIDLCAPSNNSRAFSGDVMKGLGLTTSTGDQGAVTHRFKGTSGAAALVAGVAALVLSASPNISALEVIRILITSASKELNQEGYKQPPQTTSAAAWDIPPIAPFDRGLFNDGGWSPWFGYGKVDASSAVDLAIHLQNNH